MSRLYFFCLLLITGTYSFAQKECNSAQYEEQLLKTLPAFKQNIASANSFLNNTRSEVLMGGAGGPASGILPVITIPVVVHVLYKDAYQDFTDAQVKEQIDILNKAFQLQHADTAKIPARFRDLAANCRIEFCLAKVDPKGVATNGIIRKSTWVTMFGIDDRIKYSDKGGDDAWSTDKYLNIWVGNIAGGVAGYSSPLGGPADRDGVVIITTAFGTKNGPPYNGGKTLVHEVGHWLGLRHIWGDAACGNDHVDDTPTQKTANRGCPSGIKLSCETSGNGDMYMNYMDLTNDDCMLMFTYGQMERMRAAFAPGGPRNGILSSNGCNGTPLPAPIAAPAVVIEPVVKLMNLYPNPAQSMIVIDITENTELLGSDVQLLNQFGLPVKTVRLSQNKTTIHINNMPAGMYIIKLSGSKKYQEKFLKL
jgi:hypothetical protein